MGCRVRPSLLVILMKKLLMLITVALCANAVQAEEKWLELSVYEENSQAMKQTIQVGQPNALMGAYYNADKFTSTCNFKSTDPGFPSETTFSVDTGTSLNTMALPMELTDNKVKAYLSFEKQSSKDLKWETISPDCKLPVGALHNAGLSLVDTYKLGVPAKIKLSDGTVVIVTFDKIKDTKN
jgi:hypothetical protein